MIKKLLLIIALVISLTLSSCEIFINNDQTPDSGIGDTGGGNNEILEDTSHPHTDNNNDDHCDSCGSLVLIELDFYAINDLHGKFTDTDNQPGVDELTTYLKNAHENDDNAFLLSSGDMWQGGSESNLTKGLIITEWMNELNFSSMTLGNHEFDWGEEYIKNNLELSEFPFLAINIYDKETNERVDYADASVMIEQNGIKIGIIGAIGNCYSSIASDKSQGFYFKTGTDLTDLVMSESNKLRAEGADLIVYSLHAGHDSSSGSVISDSSLSDYYSPSLSKGKYVDIVFEGHTHKNYVLKDSYGVYHIQNGGENKGIAHAEIMLNVANNNFKVTESEIVSSAVYSRLSADSLVSELLEKYKSFISVGNEILGTSPRTIYSSELEQLVADLYLEAGLQKWGNKYKIFLGGGFIRTRSPYNLDAGEVKYSDLQMIFPFDNEITLCSIKGKYLKSKFLNTSNEDYYVALSDYGIANKSSINDNAVYYVIVDSYTSGYAKNNLTVIETFDKTTFARDLLKEYVKSGGLNK